MIRMVALIRTGKPQLLGRVRQNCHGISATLVVIRPVTNLFGGKDSQESLPKRRLVTLRNSSSGNLLSCFIKLRKQSNHMEHEKHAYPRTNQTNVPGLRL